MNDLKETRKHEKGVNSGGLGGLEILTLEDCRKCWRLCDGFQVFDLKFGLSTSEVFQGTNFEIILKLFNIREQILPDSKSLIPKILGILWFCLPPEGLESSGRLVGRISTNVHHSQW